MQRRYKSGLLWCAKTVKNGLSITNRGQIPYKRAAKDNGEMKATVFAEI